MQVGPIKIPSSQFFPGESQLTGSLNFSFACSGRECLGISDAMSANQQPSNNSKDFKSLTQNMTTHSLAASLILAPQPDS